MKLGEFCCFKSRPAATATASTAINGKLHYSVTYQPCVELFSLSSPVFSLASIKWPVGLVSGDLLTQGFAVISMILFSRPIMPNVRNSH